MKTKKKLAAEIEALRDELSVVRAQLEALQADANLRLAGIRRQGRRPQGFFSYPNLSRNTRLKQLCAPEGNDSGVQGQNVAAEGALA